MTVERHSGSNGSWTRADAIRLVPTTGGVEVDATNSLLDDLYAIDSSGGTPLRSAFNEVGKYFDKGQTSSIGTSPIADAVDGGECQRNYAIQARLYTLATLRLLQVGGAADYQRRFGGVLYCFLRGMSATDPGAGVYFHRPTWDEVLAWQDAMLGHGFWGQA